MESHDPEPVAVLLVHDLLRLGRDLPDLLERASGHVTIKVSGYPPFGPQVILNGDEYVAVAAQAEAMALPRRATAETGIADPQRPGPGRSVRRACSFRA